MKEEQSEGLWQYITRLKKKHGIEERMEEEESKGLWKNTLWKYIAKLKKENGIDKEN